MARKIGEGSIVPRFVWRDAEARLGLMEEQSRRALADRMRMTSIQVIQEPEWVSPLVLPAESGYESAIQPVSADKLLFGPDGKLMGA